MSRRLICTFIQAIGVLEINVEIIQKEITPQQEKVLPCWMAKVIYAA